MTRKATSKSIWRSRAEQLGEALPIGRFHPAVTAWAAKRRKAEIWGVAFSGGADSLALLLLLWAHWPERRDRLVALHFNHRLRGREATRDEQFCRRVCAGLGLRLRVGQWRRGHQPREKLRTKYVSSPAGLMVPPPFSEAEARKARHGFFVQELKKLRSRVLWLAHQQNDIAESMFMRLARGSGAGGLAAPRPVHLIAGSPAKLRPLLALKKAELVAALRAAGAVWREDASNACDDYFRNRIRRHILPAWVKVAGRDALAGAALSRERLEEDDSALEAWLDLLAPLDRAGRMNLSVLAGKPRAVTRRALHRWLLALPLPTDLSRQAFELLLAAIERGQPTRFSLGAKGFALIRRDQLTYQAT